MTQADQFRADLCRRKIALCVRNARRHAHEAWNPENSPRERREFRRLAHESINGICGARWWKRELERATS